MKRKIVGLGSLLSIVWVLSTVSGLAQSPSTAQPGPPPVAKKNLLEQIAEGGWVMFPIGLCSVFTVYLIGDGITRTSRNKTSPPKYEHEVQNLFQAGDYVGAYKFCRENPSPLTNVLRIGISLLGEGKEATEEGMIGELAKENSQMQTQISYLSVIGVCTPMIGLLGTVTGMIRAFATLGSSGIGDPSSLASAIGEVLVATASGLMIAIPAFGAFYFLRNRASGTMHHIQDALADLFRLMPYDALAGVHLGDKKLYAALPNWLASQAPAEPAETENTGPETVQAS